MLQKNTVQLNIRIDKELKEKAEYILTEFGITPSSAISMLYSQIVMRNEFPLELKRKTSMSESSTSTKEHTDEKKSVKKYGPQPDGKVRICTPDNMFI